jgi:hypothetical protein
MILGDDLPEVRHSGVTGGWGLALQTNVTKQPLQPKTLFSAMSQIGQQFVVYGISIWSQ